MTKFPFEYDNPLVSELAWVIGSAPLLRISKGDRNSLTSEQWISRQFDLHGEWLSELDQNPSGLAAFMEERNVKLLGKRFETLILYWATNSPFLDLLFSNVQLSEEHTTVGEIDFILLDRESDRVIHLEAACKYYLSSSGSASWSTWLGPNTEDSLQTKMDKLDQQLSIFQRPSGRAFLDIHHLSAPQSMIFLKGYFFHRFNELGKSSQPKFCHPHCCAGWWMHSADLNAFRETPAQWLILPRERWIGPYYDWDSGLLRLSGEEVEAHFLHRDQKFRTSIIIQLDDDNCEISRGMIVPDSWPNK